MAPRVRRAPRLILASGIVVARPSGAAESVVWGLKNRLARLFRASNPRSPAVRDEGKSAVADPATIRRGIGIA
jgi:hypothetical protein